jgi:iron complex outermembrane recepter protein
MCRFKLDANRLAISSLALLLAMNSPGVAQTATDPKVPAPDTLPPVQVEQTQKAKSKAKSKPKTVPVAGHGTGGEGAGQLDETHHSTAYNAPNASTATKTNTPVMQTPASVQTVTRQAIEDRQPQNLQQALENVSGVTTGYGGGNSNGQPWAQVRLRGFGTSSYFLDGSRLDNLGGADATIFSQGFADVDHIEVLKGPAAILYGMLEPGGALNVVTKAPQATPYYSIEQQAGSYGLSRTTLDATGALNENGSVVYRFDGSYLNMGSRIDDVYNKNLFLAPVVQFNIDSANTVKVEFNYRNSDIGQNYGFLPLHNGVLVNSDPGDNYANTSPLRETAYFTALTYTHKFDDDWSIRNRLVYRDTSSEGLGIYPSKIVIGTAPTPSGNGVSAFMNNVFSDATNLNANTDLTGHFNTLGLRHTLLIGADYSTFESHGHINQEGQIDANVMWSDLYNPSFKVPFGGTPTLMGTSAQVTDTSGVYIQDQIKLPYNFHLLAGLREQYIDQKTNFAFPAWGLTGGSAVEATALTPRAALLWQPLKWLSVYSSYTESFGPARTYGVQSDGSPVPPSAGTQWETGIKAAFFGGKLTATAAYFDLTKTNVPSTDITNPLFVTVTGKVRSKGEEFDLQGEVYPGLNVIANYAHTEARVAESTALDPFPVGAKFGGVPDDLFHLWATYTFQSDALSGWKIGGGFTISSSAPYEMYYVPQSSVPGWQTFDLMASYKLLLDDGRKVTFQVNANNIFDKVYLTEVQARKPLTGEWTAIGGFYGDPRTIIGSIKIEF